MVKIEFETDGAAFHEATHKSFGHEVARVLELIAQEAREGNEYVGPIMDVNGNKIGAMTITDD